jgi:hypothetical protein
MQNLSELTRRLIAAEMEFVLVGGFAAVVHGSTMVTSDLDVCCRFSEKNLYRIQKALAGLNPVHRSRTDRPLNLTPTQCADLKKLYLKTDLGALDCLSEVRGIGNFNSVMKESVKVELAAGACYVLSLDGLFRAKEAMGRERDLITVKQLKEIKKQQ